MKNRILGIALMGCLIATILLIGCFRNHNPSEPQVANEGTTPLTGNGPATTGGVSFRVLLPERQTPVEGNVMAEIRAAATGTPQVTFKLILVNVGNATQPTTILTKTVPVDASGTAQATFNGVPALTCIGDVHIEGGHIGSYTDFHGAADLLPAVANVITAAPKGSKLRSDFVASLLERIIADPSLFAKAVTGLTARLETTLSGFNYETGTLEQAVAVFESFTGTVNQVQTGASVPIAEQVLPTTGGTVTFASQSNSLNGLQVTVQPGAFDGNTDFRITAAEITTHTLGIGFNPATPLISIENGGMYASIPVTVKIPVQVQTDEFAMVYEFDPATGKLTPVPAVNLQADSVTIATNRFGPAGPSASIRRSILTGFNVLPGFIVRIVKRDILSQLPSVSSEFQVGRDNFSFVNYGSYITPGGLCAGQSIAAIWYFKNRRNPQLFGYLDNNGTYDQSGVGATPNSQWDDTRLYKFAAAVHHDQYSRIFKLLDYFGGSLVADQDIFNSFREAISTTKQPQLLGMWGYDSNNNRVGHAMVVYKADPDGLWVCDPNYPNGTERKIGFAAGRFSAYSSAKNAAEIAAGKGILFSDFRFLGDSALYNDSTCKQRWDETEAGTIGNDLFPQYELSIKKADGTTQVLTNGVHVAENTLVLDGKTLWHGLTLSNNLHIWAWAGSSGVIANGANPLTVPLQSGENIIGITLWATPTSLLSSNGEEWLDHKWVKIYCDAPPKPTIKITGLVNGTIITKGTDKLLTVDVTAGPGRTIAKIEFASGTIKIGSSTVSPFSFNWLSIPAGNYSLTAKATDNQGAVWVSDPITITVPGIPHGQTIGSINGVNVYSNSHVGYNDILSRNEYNFVGVATSGLKWECVEFVNRYYLSVFGKNIRWTGGNAKDYYSTAGNRGLATFPNDGLNFPQVGDILVSEGDGVNLGHVAIVREVNTDTVYVTQQNWTNTDVDLNFGIAREGNTINGFGTSGKYPVKGWLRIPSAEIEMVEIQAGTFQMGSNRSFWGSDAQPVHQVTLSKKFLIGKYEVMQSEYSRVVGINPSYFKNETSGTQPVDSVSWSCAFG